ncbi:4-(cytidine 5'-diphospho)-2-C-methyl-D-erythritol kinase [Terrihabitans sp. B22-R8]|uniref:4-(cytidine 5'-diphospho)-2-C-methyl-D-erythritol kinase n=1 Tax=Terrihabitans sp. B22-R8 TaxID=3425128 RepID=UPI00403D0EF9
MNLTARAPAKINLTLRVLGRRIDGYHELESLVAFAGTCDLVALDPERSFGLDIDGPTAAAAGPDSDNLVIRAGRALEERVPGLRLGRFTLKKRLPVAAGLGGGSSDAAAALRLLAQLNGLDIADPRIAEAAAEVGSDVPVCLTPSARMFGGRGEEVSAPMALPPLYTVLVNPGVHLSTADVFRALKLKPGAPGPSRPSFDPDFAVGFEALLGLLNDDVNDLEPPARALSPQISEALEAVAGTEGCRFARMSGSGATVFGLFDDCHAAARAARSLRAAHPAYWVKPTLLR